MCKEVLPAKHPKIPVAMRFDHWSNNIASEERPGYEVHRKYTLLIWFQQGLAFAERVVSEWYFQNEVAYIKHTKTLVFHRDNRKISMGRIKLRVQFSIPQTRIIAKKPHHQFQICSIMMMYKIVIDKREKLTQLSHLHPITVPWGNTFDWSTEA